MAIPTRIGITFGTGKAPAVRAAIKGQVINSLITHRAVAGEVLGLV